MAGVHEPDTATPWARRMAVMISFLAAVLALAEIGATASQTAYLTAHIAASESRGARQALAVRAKVNDTLVTLLSSAPNATEAAIQARIDAARAEEARLLDDPEGGNGVRQLAAKTTALEAERDQAYHVYHAYEQMSAVLEIAIVLASVSVVTRVRQLGWTAGVLGVGAAAAGMAVVLHLI